MDIYRNFIGNLKQKNDWIGDEKMKSKQINLDNEERFIKKSNMGWVLKFIFKNEQNLRFAYRIMKMIKEERKGMRVYGNQMKICKKLGISYLHYRKILDKMKEFGLIHLSRFYHPTLIGNKLPKEESALNENIISYTERKHKSDYIVLSDSSELSKHLSEFIKEWVRFRQTYPMIIRLTEDERLEEV